MENFIGEIRLAGFGIVPRYWAVCDGSLLPINQNQALFSLLGTYYGGNGITAFALPDLRSRVPVGFGQGYALGQKAGTEAVTLTADQLPAHEHASVSGTINTADEAVNTDPADQFPSVCSVNQYAPGPATSTLAADALQLTVQPAGNNLPHENRQPYQALNYIIALQGIFPSRD
ncbi:phage tail protein [Hymenobacter lutimineralis]|uniref:Phage tail protein n=1 Tax=Hymenobacter lutimineralis TaxID=2606448 RepID=A0A5D6V0T3_9BACT|nr:tail fiber protein [Hymenobacter lutimineralis]TYZ08399.1 phage tail protein [Hymenobacter lutimineralis]